MHTLHTKFVVSTSEAVHIEVCEKQEAKRLLDAQLKTQCRVAKADERHRDHCILNPLMDKLTQVGMCVALLLLAGCGNPTYILDSRLKLAESVTTPPGQPNYCIYHDSVSGRDIVVFLGGGNTAIILPAKPE